MKIPHFLLCMTLSFFPLKVFAQENSNDGWAFTIGTGMVVSPSYFGDDEYKLSILPNLQIKYKDKFFPPYKKGLAIISSTIKIGASDQLLDIILAETKMAKALFKSVAIRVS